MKIKAIGLAVLGILVWAGSTPAQTSPASTGPTSHAVAFRPFFLATIQDFTAHETFTSAFGQDTFPFYGGGVDMVFRHGIFLDVTVSHFKATGERAFVFNGQTYRLGIPLTVTESPVEVSAGYRFREWHRIRPYAGGGVGSYSYSETSDSSDSGENARMTHAGYLLVGGGELRVTSWVALAVDVEWTHVPGILGKAGLSQGSDNDLGGVATRFRVIIGR